MEGSEDQDGNCATCGAEIAQGVPISKIENPTFSQNADFLRYSKHVCVACAWLYWAGKGKPGNFLAANNKYEQLVISHESVVEDKDNWHSALTKLSKLPPDTLACGVLTTDVKPRLWPRTKLVTVGNFGLHVHAQDYDLSAFVQFDLAECLAISTIMLDPLISGFSKQSIFHGLLTDYQRASKQISITMHWEQALSPIRSSPAFIPALLITGTTKEAKKDVRNIGNDRPVRAAAESGNQPSETQLGLF